MSILLAGVTDPDLRGRIASLSRLIAETQLSQAQEYWIHTDILDDSREVEVTLRELARDDEEEIEER